MRLRRRYHTRTAGFVYVFITLLIALGAFNSQNNLLFWGFGLSISILLVSGIISGTMLMGITAVREPPSSADLRVGEPTSLRYRVRNRGLMPAFGLRIDESAPPDADDAGDQAPAFVVHVGPREEVVAETAFTPSRRGLLTLPGFRIYTTFPFGLIGKSVEFRGDTRVLIRPRRLRLSGSSRDAGSGSVGSGRQRSRSGDGDEFFSLRGYRAGDDWRRVAWRPSARSGTLLVREQSAPVPRRTWVVLLLGPAGDAQRDEDAIALAAAHVEAAAAEGIEVGLAVPASNLLRFPRAGRRQAGMLLDDLAALDLEALSASRGTAAETLPSAAIGRRSLCLAVHAADGFQAAPHPGVSHIFASRMDHYTAPSEAAAGRPAEVAA